MSKTENQLWEIYIKNHPNWVNDNITLTPAGLKKLVNETYKHGYKHGITMSSKVRDTIGNSSVFGHNNSKESGGYASDLFNDIFK